MRIGRVWILVFALGLPALAGVEWLYRDAREGRSPLGTAEWIWPDVPVSTPLPRSFLAARDFHLEGLDGPEDWALEATGTPDIRLWLNGQPVLADHGAIDGRLIRVSVGELLQPGTNRLVAELRSPWGWGAFIVCLRGPTGDCRVESDREWRAYQELPAGLYEGWGRLPRGELRMASWGRPPEGRWQLTGVVERSPVYTCFEQETQEEGRPRGHWPERTDLRGLRVDLERNVHGFLSLDIDDPEASMALLRTTIAEPLLSSYGPGEGEPILFIAGQRRYQELHPRTLRYLEILGLEDLEGVHVTPLRQGCLLGPDAPLESLWGLSAPSSVSTVEDEIRRELQGLAGRGGS